MKKLSLLGMLFLALLGCRNDIDQIIDGGTTTEPPIIISEYNPSSELVEGTIFGRVYDEQENPIANAQVKYDGKNYTTDEEGRFFIIDETLDKQGTFLTVEADGFFKGSRRFNPQDNSVNYVYIQLLALNEIGNFESSNGAELIGDDGLRISFPPNSIQSASGTLYDGQVSVAAKWLDPTADNIGEIMPGNLLGLNSRIEEVALQSYGMMTVDLFGENGEKLNIAEGNTATLSFPIPADLLGSAPEEIPLWSFEDEQYGIWAEEGTATIQNGMYVGEVSHFSFWNCDAPFEVVFIEGQLISPNGNPLQNASVGIFRVNASNGRHGKTDNRGFFAGKVPKGELLTLVVGYTGADCEFESINIGPFEEDMNIGQIQLEEADNSFTLIGSIVDCNDDPVTNGLINISIGSIDLGIYIYNESTFEIDLLNCEGVNSVNIKVLDLDNLTENSVQSFSISPQVNTGSLKACEQAITEFFILEYFGTADTTFNGAGMSAYLGNTTESYTLFAGQGVGNSESISIITVVDNLQVGMYNNNGVELIENSGEGDPWNERCHLRDPNATYTLDITKNDNFIGGIFAGKIEGITDIFCVDPNGGSQNETLDDEPFKFEFQLIIE